MNRGIDWYGRRAVTNIRKSIILHIKCAGGDRRFPIAWELGIPEFGFGLIFPAPSPA